MPISFYDATGKIISVFSSNPETEALNKELSINPWVEGDHINKDVWVCDGIVTPRSEHPAVLTGKELSQLPPNTIIKINGSSYPCEEPTATLSFNHPGTYQVIVSSWPYLDKEFSIVN